MPLDYANAGLPQPGGMPTIDFSIYTAGMEIDEQFISTERPIVRMIGSSTEQDLHRDTMTQTALADMMNRAAPGLLIWLNHDYTVPDSLFGSLCEKPMIVQKSGIADLHLAVEVELDNPAAAKTYKFIKNRRRLGCSVGCQVEDYELVDSGLPKGSPGYDMPLVHITHVRPVEWSVVGVPANQRSWVENAIRGIFERALTTPGREEEAIRLAPVMKSLWQKDFKRIVSGVEASDLRKSLFDTPSRPTPPQRLLWEPESHKFFYTQGTSEVRYEVPAERVETTMDALRKSFEPSVQFAGSTQTVNSSALTATVKIEVDTTALDQALETVRGYDVVANGTAKAADEAAKTAQEARSHKYGIGVKEGGNVTKPGEWSSIPDSEWGDPVNYRYPMPDKAHADNAASRWGDASNRSQYSNEEQAIISRRIQARQAHFGESSSDEKEKSVDPIVLKTEVLEDGTELKTWDNGEQTAITYIKHADGVVEQLDVIVKSDGSHAPFTGTHTHQHANDGEMHSHSHAHDNDADHGHSHEDDGDDMEEKSGEAEHTAEGSDVVAVVTPADEPAPEEPAIEAELEAVEAAPEEELTEAQKTLLASYNQIGSALGFAPVTIKAKGPDATPQEVAMLAQAIDDAADKLLRVLGIPDIDKDNASDLDEKAVGELARKAGKEISSRNMNKIKAVHDMLAEMSMGTHCSMYCSMDEKSVEPTVLEPAKIELDADLVKSALAEVLGDVPAQLAALAEALKGLDTPVLHEQVESARTELANTKKSLETVRTEAAALTKAIEDFGNTGMGRPTQMRRQLADGTVVDVAGQSSVITNGLVSEASREAKTLEEALEQTTMQYVPGIGMCRAWPDGVGKGFRPSLTPEQMAGMNAYSILNYLNGGQALVPNV